MSLPSPLEGERYPLRVRAYWIVSPKQSPASGRTGQGTRSVVSSWIPRRWKGVQGRFSAIADPGVTGSCHSVGISLILGTTGH